MKSEWWMLTRNINLLIFCFHLWYIILYRFLKNILHKLLNITPELFKNYVWWVKLCKGIWRYRERCRNAGLIDWEAEEMRKVRNDTRPGNDSGRTLTSCRTLSDSEMEMDRDGEGQWRRSEARESSDEFWSFSVPDVPGDHPKLHHHVRSSP